MLRKDEESVIRLECPHQPHTNMVRVDCQPPKVVFSGCDDCAKQFYEACMNLGGESVKPKNLM